MVQFGAAQKMQNFLSARTVIFGETAAEYFRYIYSLGLPASVTGGS
jgi:hypothetical protein